MEVMTVSTNPSIRVIDNPVDKNSGLVWYRLHAEREDICEALLKESAPGDEGQAGTERVSNEDVMRTAIWHREMLQARLRKTDDALDRLMAGLYGNCSKCGKWIEDTKLEYDPAIEFCVDCWQRVKDGVLKVAIRP